MLELHRLESLNAALKKMLLLLCEDILIMIVKLIFMEIKFLGGKYPWVIVCGGGLFLVVIFWGQLSERNFYFYHSLQIQH